MAQLTTCQFFFGYNYGQHLTLWDRIGSTFRSLLKGKGATGNVQMVMSEKHSSQARTGCKNEGLFNGL